MRPLALAVGLLLVGAPALGAQSPKSTTPAPTAAPQGVIPLIPGQRVRVTSKQLVTPLIANFLESKADTLIFFEGGTGRGIWSLTLEQIDKIETTVGQKKGHKKYILIGAGIGGGVVGLASAFVASNYHPSDSTRDYNNVKSGLVGVVVGAGAGALIGSRFGAEKWRPVTLPGRISVVPEGHGRWAFKASVAF